MKSKFELPSEKPGSRWVDQHLEKTASPERRRPRWLFFMGGVGLGGSLGAIGYSVELGDYWVVGLFSLIALGFVVVLVWQSI